MLILHYSTNILTSCSHLFAQLSSHQNAHDGCHHQAASPARGVSEAVKVLHIRVEVSVNVNLIAVELQLR